tara:strand:- start:309 stop:842 length:534 start_codon:yes stop_codon:yes gene_type:complete
MSELGVFMAKLSKSRMVWAINETQSMRQASKLCGVAYNTFKKYAKLYDIWAPLESNAGISQGSSGGLKPVELEDIFAGKNPSYSTTKLLHRCFREGYLAEECSNCGYDEYRPSDMTKPLMLDYLDDDQTNKELTNLRVLCYCCYYILKMDRLDVDVPANVKSFQKAIYNAFNRSSKS